MQRDYERNRSMLNKRKSLKEINAHYSGNGTPEYTEKKLTGQEMHEFREKLILEKKREYRRLSALFVIISAITVTGFWLFFF
jgi:hypothetical protein